MNDKKRAKKQAKRKKKTALIICRDRSQFWTTQAQFWQWLREGVITQTGVKPLTGVLNQDHADKIVVISSTVLNLAHPRHLSEVLRARRQVRLK